MSVYVRTQFVHGIGALFTYKYMNRNKENISNYDYVYQAKNC